MLRENGLETPLLEHRLLNAWPQVAAPWGERYTTQRFIRNQVLWVKVTSPALRQDLTMLRATLVQKLNAAVGAQVITDIRFF